jgi:hypothetical protein
MEQIKNQPIANNDISIENYAINLTAKKVGVFYSKV